MEANAEAARLGLLHASEKEPKLARSHRSQQSNPDNNPVETAEAVSPKTNDAYCFLTSEVFKALLRITTRRRIGSLVDHINLRPDDTLSAVETAPPADSTRLHVATRIAPKAAKALSLSALSSTLSSEKKAMENSKTQMALVMRKCLRRKSCGKRLDSELAFLLVALRTTRLFRNHTADWPPHLKTYLCNHGLHFKSVLKGRTLFKLGEMAEYAYLVMKGGLEEQAARNGIDRQSKLSARVNVVRPGDIAGELALKGVGSRVKTCIAQEKSDVLVINVGIFMTLAQRQPSFKERFALLRKVDALSAFDMRRAYTLAFSFSEEHPTKDTVVTDVGQTPAGLHVIMSGTIGVYVVDSDKGGTNDNDVQKKRLVSCLEQGEIFDSVGILAAVARLKRNHPGMRSTVQYVVHTHNCRLLELPVSSYNLILESSNTVDKLYQLECNRALVYGNSIQGWRNAINVVMETNRLSATAPLATAATVVKANDGTEERRPRAMSSIEKLVRRSRSESLVSAQQTLQGDYLRSLGRPFSKIALLAGTAVSPAIVRTRTHKEKDGPKEKDGQHDSRQEQHGATLAQNWWNQVDQFGAQATPAAGSQVAGLRSSSACLM
jgi:CRP-like cAMP-binding protein